MKSENTSSKCINSAEIETIEKLHDYHDNKNKFRPVKFYMSKTFEEVPNMIANSPTTKISTVYLQQKLDENEIYQIPALLRLLL